MMRARRPSIYKTSDRHVIRLRKICDSASAEAFKKLLKWVSPLWTPPTSYEEYLKNVKNVSMKKFKSDLKPSQKAVMKKDPLGTTYDVSLLYLLILWGNDGLADKDDPAWRKGGGNLESLITSVKDDRNSLMHCYNKVDAKEFHKRTVDLHSLLWDMIISAGARYTHVSQAEIDQTLQELGILIEKSKNDPIEPKGLLHCKLILILLIVIPVVVLYTVQSRQNIDVKVEGKPALRQLYKSYSRTTPVSHMNNISFYIEDIFTEMVLINETLNGKDIEIKFEDILGNSTQNISDPIILIEGIAGVGKTTLTKRILNEWVSGQTNMKYLNTYDIVLYSEFRNFIIKSFKELLQTLMPKIAATFLGDDFIYATLKHKILIIIDGFDELNNASASLFSDILSLKKNHIITILVTSRPERVKYFYTRVNSLQINVEHIHVLGISQGKREDFIIKYHREMAKRNSKIQAVDGLLQFVKRTENHFSGMWKLPYNLVLLTILWVYNANAVNRITTTPELYWQMHQLYLLKLEERLWSNEATRHLPEDLLEKKIEYFINSLCREALVSLKNDQIILPEKAYQRLKAICFESDIPPDEMIGAFLNKKVIKTLFKFHTSYNFPHKGFQDFLGALFIFTRISRKSEIQPMNTEANATSQRSTMIRNILKDPHGLQSSISSSASSLPPLEIDKYQNLLIILIGLFYLDSNTIKNDIKLEALNLLKETGIARKENWLRILDSVKYDEFVATFVSKQSDVLVGYIEIDDSTIFAYVSILKALKTSLNDTSKVTMSLNTLGDVSALGELLKLINVHQIKLKHILVSDDNLSQYTLALKALPPTFNDAHNVSVDLEISRDAKHIDDLIAHISVHQFKVRYVYITDKNYMRYTSLLKALPPALRKPHPVTIRMRIEEEASHISDMMDVINRNKYNVATMFLMHDFKNPTVNLAIENSINEIFQRCEVNAYAGVLTPHMKLPKSLMRCSVSLADGDCYGPLARYFQTKPKLKQLFVSVNHTTNPSDLKPLPDVPPWLFLPDIQTDLDMDRALQIAKSLQPINVKRSFQYIVFPKLSPEGDLIKKIIEGLGSRGVKVDESLVFPSACKFPSLEDEQQIRELVKEELSEGNDVVWGKIPDLVNIVDDW